MAEVLKVLKLAQKNGVAEMEIGRGRIEPRLDAKRLARRQRLLQLGAKLGLLHDFRGTLFDVSELFVDRRETGHRVKIIAASGPT